MCHAWQLQSAPEPLHVDGALSPKHVPSALLRLVVLADRTDVSELQLVTLNAPALPESNSPSALDPAWFGSAAATPNSASAAATASGRGGSRGLSGVKLDWAVSFPSAKSATLPPLVLGAARRCDGLCGTAGRRVESAIKKEFSHSPLQK
jgi:hypothetical protein